jgi:hypothetical protein
MMGDGKAQSSILYIEIITNHDTSGTVLIPCCCGPRVLNNNHVLWYAQKKGGDHGFEYEKN